MFTYSQILQNGFNSFDTIFFDYVRFWFVFCLAIIIILALFDLFFRQ
jgi:uncharacterized membrane protein